MGISAKISISLFVVSLLVIGSILLLPNKANPIVKVEKKEDLEPAMREAFSLKDRLVFLDVFVEPHEHIYPMHVAPSGAMKDMWLSKTERT